MLTIDLHLKFRALELQQNWFTSCSPERCCSAVSAVVSPVSRAPPFPCTPWDPWGGSGGCPEGRATLVLVEPDDGEHLDGRRILGQTRLGATNANPLRHHRVQTWRKAYNIHSRTWKSLNLFRLLILILLNRLKLLKLKEILSLIYANR